MSFHFFFVPPLEKEKKPTQKLPPPLPHPESDPGCEVTAAVTKKVIGAMTTVWHAPPPAPASVPARPER